MKFSVVLLIIITAYEVIILLRILVNLYESTKAIYPGTLPYFLKVFAFTPTDPIMKPLCRLIPTHVGGIWLAPLLVLLLLEILKNVIR